MKNSGKPATGVAYTVGKGNYEERIIHAGLTKREHFAGLAMQALLSNSSMGDSDLWDTPQEWVKQMTESGVEMADALLKQLESKG